jgi:hypothetical protein
LSSLLSAVCTTGRLDDLHGRQPRVRLGRAAPAQRRRQHHRHVSPERALSLSLSRSRSMPDLADLLQPADHRSCSIYLPIACSNASEANIYVQSLTVNGQPVTKPFLDHSQLKGRRFLCKHDRARSWLELRLLTQRLVPCVFFAGGSNVVFTMGPQPSSWGRFTPTGSAKDTLAEPAFPQPHPR